VELEILHKIQNSRSFWTDGNLLYLARGMSIFAAYGPSQKPLLKHTFGAALEGVFARMRPLRHLLRLGIHHFWPLPNGEFLAVARKKLYHLDANNRATLSMRFSRGNKPASKGVCVTPNGSVFVGEYAQNPGRSLPVFLYRSDDMGRSFKPILEFAPGDIRHIHFVQWDPIAQCLWLGTGDADSESRLYKSVDNGNHWELIGSGSQFWRAVGLCIHPDALFWGTDAGCDTGEHPNCVMRMDRKTSQVTRVLQLQGPCHGNAVLKDGTLLVSTGIEGGRNEVDLSAHLWASRDGTSWDEVASYKKDFWPKIIQFGVIRFPNGLEKSDNIIFNCMGLQGAGETVYIGRIK
jgi:hypothetical protein